jgi:hypothetical protein
MHGTRVSRAMTTKQTFTKQGVRDLNHYGPRPGKAAASASTPGSGGDTKAVPPVPEKGHTVPSPVGEGKREAP